MFRQARVALLAIALVPLIVAADWPMLGRDRTHNAVTLEPGAPVDWQIAVPASKDGPARAARNVKWSAKLGSMSLGGPVIAGGLVWVGTNNQNPRDPRDFRVRRDGRKEPIDKGVLMCFRESDGTFLWQLTASRHPAGMIHDGPNDAMGSTPLAEGDRLWLINNRREVVCLDVGPLRRGAGEPKTLWTVNLLTTFGVFPHSEIMAVGLAASPVADGERLFIVTGNGVDEDHVNVPAPNAPSLVCLDRRTGKTLWTDASPGKNILHTQLSSPLVIDVAGGTQVVVGQGDGWLRAFDAVTGKVVWACDANPKGSKYDLGGRGRRNYFMATPVWYEGRIYIGLGQSPEHGAGESDLLCIDPGGTGDVSAELPDGRDRGKPNPNSRVVWTYGGPAPKGRDRDYLFSRTLGQCAVHEGLVYACGIDGIMHCLDAKTGRPYWEHDLRGTCWGGPLWADGKVYVGTDDCNLEVFAHGKDRKPLATIEMNEVVRTTPVFANGTLYVMTDRSLHAIKGTR